MDFALERDAGTEFVLRFLPYLESPDGTPAADIIGHWGRGYGYGDLEEYFYSQAAAEMRCDWLHAAGVVERWEVRRFDPGGGQYYSILASSSEES